MHFTIIQEILGGYSIIFSLVFLVWHLNPANQYFGSTSVAEMCFSNLPGIFTFNLYSKTEFQIGLF